MSHLDLNKQTGDSRVGESREQRGTGFSGAGEVRTASTVKESNLQSGNICLVFLRVGAGNEKEEDTGQVRVLREGEEMGVSLLLPPTLRELLAHGAPTTFLLAFLQCRCLILPQDLCISYSSGLDYLLL